MFVFIKFIYLFEYFFTIFVIKINKDLKISNIMPKKVFSITNIHLYTFSCNLKELNCYIPYSQKYLKNIITILQDKMYYYMKMFIITAVKLKGLKSIRNISIYSYAVISSKCSAHNL